MGSSPNADDTTPGAGFHARLTTSLNPVAAVAGALPEENAIAFGLPHADLTYLHDFLTCFSEQRSREGYTLQSCDGWPLKAKEQESKPEEITVDHLTDHASLPCSDEGRKDVDIMTIAKYFRLPISTAAQRLQVGETWLKQKCRQHNIIRWPYRKVRSIEKFMRKIEANLRDECASGGTQHRIAQFRQQLAELEAARSEICMGQAPATDCDNVKDDPDESDDGAAAELDSPARPPKRHLEEGHAPAVSINLKSEEDNYTFKKLCVPKMSALADASEPAGASHMMNLVLSPRSSRELTLASPMAAKIMVPDFELECPNSASHSETSTLFLSPDRRRLRTTMSPSPRSFKFTSSPSPRTLKTQTELFGLSCLFAEDDMLSLHDFTPMCSTPTEGSAPLHGGSAFQGDYNLAFDSAMPAFLC
eukprot:CAMPEP_0117685046 /NCGR_PEP_ID=MMETSP0804-20121206/21506_1 /TAXON_ID=1074897 /ORGANISM="Tetraselmis astigmatica, Strain CCMP880" /LENGTH=418 /DNA_ID=CAMNT_0005496243 /DNA_START=391 /DNA_END=1647 /DNA_ORIENTATION=-